MTAERRVGEETPFSAWLRSREDLDSYDQSIAVNDIDYIFHKYQTKSHEGWTRGFQLQMHVEVKTQGKYPGESQLEILYYNHQLLNAGKTVEVKRRLGRPSITLYHFGCYVLVLSGSAPVMGEDMHWGIFRDGEIQYSTTVNVDSIADILGFRRRPDKPWELLHL